MNRVKFLAFLMLALSQFAFAGSSNFADQMADTPCSAQVKEKLSPFLQKQGWYLVTIAPDNKPLLYGIAFRDTRTGMAYQIWADASREANLIETNIKTGTDTQYTWESASACKMQTATHPTPKMVGVTDMGFKDADLYAVMKAHKWGVIYVWSPYMPLSVEGLKTIKEAVAAKGGHVTVLMDGRANTEQAKKWVSKGRALASEMTPVASNELYAREMGLHYPITFLYKDGFLSDRTYVGWKSAKVYKRWVEIELENLNKDMKK